MDAFSPKQMHPRHLKHAKCQVFVDANFILGKFRVVDMKDYYCRWQTDYAKSFEQMAIFEASCNSAER